MINVCVTQTKTTTTSNLKIKKWLNIILAELCNYILGFLINQIEGISCLKNETKKMVKIARLY